jgi:hypothetical protein
MNSFATMETKTMSDVRRLYEAMLVDSGNAKKRKNLEMLWAILLEMQKKGAYDYSVSKVGTELGKLPGGMRTQSIHNAKGVHFKRLIQAFGTAVGGSLTKVAKDKSQADRAIDMISDPGIRSVLRQSLERLKKLEHENDDLRSAFKHLRIWNSDPMHRAVPSIETITGKSGANLSERRPASVISTRLADALRKGIDRDRLAERGLNVLEDGSIINGKTVLFPPGFVEAIFAILLYEDKICYDSID